MNENAPYRVAPSYGLEKCPHCGGLTAAIAHDELRWVCGACGGPVIPGVDATKLDEEATRELRAVVKARSGKALRNVLLATLISFALGFVLLPARWLALALGAASLLVAAFTSFVEGSRREKRHASAELTLLEAWTRAAAYVASARGGFITAKELGELTRISVDDAEEILTRLSVDRGRVDIGADQQLHYRVDASEPLDSEPPSASVKRANE